MMSTNDFDSIFGVRHNLHVTTIRLKKQAMPTSGTEAVQGVLLHAVRRVLFTNDCNMNTTGSFPDIDLKDTDDGNSALDLNLVVVVIIMIFCVCMVCCCVIDM